MLDPSLVFPGYGISEATVSVTTKPFPGVLGGRVKNVPGYESLNGNLRLVLLHWVSQKLSYP